MTIERISDIAFLLHEITTTTDSVKALQQRLERALEEGSGMTRQAIRELKQIVTDFDPTVSDSRCKAALNLLDNYGSSAAK